MYISLILIELVRLKHYLLVGCVFFWWRDFPCELNIIVFLWTNNHFFSQLYRN